MTFDDGDVVLENLDDHFKYAFCLKTYKIGQDSLPAMEYVAQV